MILLTMTISVGGIIYSTIVCVYSLSTGPVNSIETVYKNAFDDAFVILNAVLSISGWLLFLATAGSTTPLVAGLFVMAEAVFVMKELINIALFYGYDAAAINPQDSAESISQQVLAIKALDAHKNTMWVKLVAAVCLTLIIAGWCLVPEGLVVGALSLLAIALVYLIEQIALERIKDAMVVPLKPMIDAGTDIDAPWWEDPCELKTTPRRDLEASNDESCDIDQGHDWYHESNHSTGLTSQVGLFSRKQIQAKSMQKRCVSDKPSYQ